MILLSGKLYQHRIGGKPYGFNLRVHRPGQIPEVRASSGPIKMWASVRAVSGSEKATCPALLELHLFRTEPPSGVRLNLGTVSSCEEHGLGLRVYLGRMISRIAGLEACDMLIVKYEKDATGPTLSIPCDEYGEIQKRLALQEKRKGHRK